MYSRVHGDCSPSRALRVRPTRVARTLEYVVTVVAMDSRVQKLPRVRGGSYKGTKISGGGEVI